MRRNIIAVTGGIGSGKSYFCKLLKPYGINVYDCDQRAKEIMRTSIEIQQQLKRLIGSDVIRNGMIEKKIIANFLLSSEQNAQKINQIIHPAVAEDFLNSDHTWLECAILFESGFDRKVSPDKIIVVAAPLEQRINRIMQRDQITEAQAKQWIDKQMPQEELISRADHVIHNDDGKDLTQEVRQLLQTLNA